jgi:alpha-mannosidase
VLQEYRSFAVPLIKSEIIGAPRLCREGALITLSPDSLEVSCIKRAERENSLVIRVWNPSNQPQPGKVALGIAFKSVVAANLNEEPEDGAALRLKRVGKRAVAFTVPPQRIVTFLFRGVKGVK